jgi:hypothetical protein
MAKLTALNNAPSSTKAPETEVPRREHVVTARRNGNFGTFYCNLYYRREIALNIGQSNRAVGVSWKQGSGGMAARIVSFQRAKM